MNKLCVKPQMSDAQAAQLKGKMLNASHVTNLTRAQKIEQKEKPYCLTIQNADGRTGWYPFYAHNDMAADYRANVLLETFGPQFEPQARTLLIALRPVPWVERTASNFKRRLIAALDNELALTAVAVGASAPPSARRTHQGKNCS